MKGMELSKAYFETYGREMIRKNFPQYEHKIAAGLVGEGSECFGYDDACSQDHDFGPGFCIWLPDDLYRQIGPSLQQQYDQLPANFQGFIRNETEHGGGRVGVFSINGFYAKYTGCQGAPKDNMEWFRIPERFLATAVNGQVFYDNWGEFSKIRRILLDFYPEDVLRKKLAARAAIMAQSGQYNYLRCCRRSDYRAAFLACGEFVNAALSAVYLLNGAYIPFYKWAFRGTEALTTLQDAISDLSQLTSLQDCYENQTKKQLLIENICVQVGRELNRRGFSSTGEAFLQVHCPEIMAGIRDERLRNLHVMADAN